MVLTCTCVPWYQSQRSSTLVKYKCFQNLQTWLPTWPFFMIRSQRRLSSNSSRALAKSAAKADPLACKPQKNANPMHPLSHIKTTNWNTWTSFVMFKIFLWQFISSYHLSPHLIMSDVLRTKSSPWNQAQWNQCVPPQNRPAPQLVVGSTEQYIGHCTSPVENCKWNETISKKKKAL